MSEGTEVEVLRRQLEEEKAAHGATRRKLDHVELQHQQTTVRLETASYLLNNAYNLLDRLPQLVDKTVEDVKVEKRGRDHFNVLMDEQKVRLDELYKRQEGFFSKTENGQTGATGSKVCGAVPKATSPKAILGGSTPWPADSLPLGATAAALAGSSSTRGHAALDIGVSVEERRTFSQKQTLSLVKKEQEESDVVSESEEVDVPKQHGKRTKLP